MDSLISKLKNRETILLYGLTPPRVTCSQEKIRSITEKRMERIKKISIDGLVIYDIQNEEARTTQTRPFPFLETVDSILYRDLYMKDLNLPTVVYQCVGKYSPKEISKRIKHLEKSCAVFVGASSRTETIKCPLSVAYDLLEMTSEKPFWGAVTIPERHENKGGEERRILSKQARGANFIISQFIFNGERLKNVLSDYFYACKNENRIMVPFIFTVTPCGSHKTLDLLQWLGVDIPAWIKNELTCSDNALEQSMELCMAIVKDISQFCLERGIPFGCNVESVSVGRDEVLASFELVNRIEEFFHVLGVRD